MCVCLSLMSGQRTWTGFVTSGASLPGRVLSSADAGSIPGSPRASHSQMQVAMLRCSKRHSAWDPARPETSIFWPLHSPAPCPCCWSRRHQGWHLIRGAAREHQLLGIPSGAASLFHG